MGREHLRLEGKVAIVTGAGSRGPGVGTGKAASILMAREGARVLLVDVEPHRARETLETIRGEGRGVGLCGRRHQRRRLPGDGEGRGRGTIGVRYQTQHGLC